MPLHAGEKAAPFLSFSDLHSFISKHLWNIGTSYFFLSKVINHNFIVQQTSDKTHRPSGIISSLVIIGGLNCMFHLSMLIHFNSKVFRSIKCRGYQNAPVFCSTK